MKIILKLQENIILKQQMYFLKKVSTFLALLYR